MSSTIQSLAAAVGRALQPLATFFSSDGGVIELVRLVGYDLPATPPSLQAMRTGLVSLYASAGGVALADPPDDAQLATLAADLALVIGDVRALPARLRDDLPAAYVSATRIADDLGPRLLDWLLCAELAASSPVLASGLRVLGIIEITEKPADPARFQPPFERRQIRWDRISMLIDPAALARDVYGWGTPALATTKLFEALLPFTFSIAMPGELRCPDENFLARLALGAEQTTELWVPLVRGDVTVFLVVTPLPGAGPTALALTLVPEGAADIAVPLTSGLSLQLAGSAQIATGAAIVLDPTSGVRGVLDAFGTGIAQASGTLEARLQRAIDDWETPPGVTGEGTGWSVDRWSVAVGAAASSSSLEPYAEIELDHASLVAAPPSGDGLLAALVPSSGVTADVSCALRWTPAGLAFRGSGGLRVRVPVGAGPAGCRITAVDLSIDAADDKIEVIAGAALETAIGPVHLALDRLGVRATLLVTPGNLGPCDVSVGIAPPTAAAIAIDAPVVQGGGGLIFDPESHRYGGALTAKLGPIGVSAFGLIDTRPPDGGYALLVALAARGLGIEIGLGFTIDSLGGLVGLHHALDTDAVRARLRTGGIDLFPSDPVVALPAALELLTSVFPAVHGRYLIAPTARILWREQLQADLMVALELPSPIRISVLGSIEAGLPTLDHRIVDLRLDLLGVWDIDRDTLSLDASLHDSSIAGYPLAGDMALRAGWGADKYLLLAIGGFHPKFAPPPGFPALRRLSLTAGDNPSLQLDAYFALTSNTAQVGAHVHLAYHGGGFDITAELGFDALFEFVPFHFEIEIAAGASISWHGHHLLGVSLDGTLSGPHPWHAKGDATFSVLWWDVSVGFDQTWGDGTPPPLPPAPDVAKRLTDALGAPQAWSFELAAGERPWVTTVSTDRGHPHAALTIRQRAVPLDYDIDQLDTIPLPHAERYSILSATVGTSTLTPPTLTDVFAPAQYTQMSTDDRLGAPSFEPLDAGVSIAGGAVARGAAVTTSMDIETVPVDPLAPPDAPPRSAMDAALAAGLLNLHVDPEVPTGPKLSPLRYALATVDGLQATPETTAIAGGATTYHALASAARRAGAQVQVVAAVELQ